MAAPDTQQVIYEVECAPDPAIVADFDAWLPGYVRQVLACPGFTGAEVQRPALDENGVPVRRLQYRLESAAALERYLAEDAPRLHAEMAAHFGDRVACTKRVLVPNDADPCLPETPVTCRNCSAVVTGKYCAECGQSGEVRVLSISDVARDIVHSVLHLDSSVWRTVRSLVLRPGELTNEFISGRRQRYLAPFRLYLVISVAFFALSALLPRSPVLRVNDAGETVVAPITLRLPGSVGSEATTQGATDNTQQTQRAAADPGAPVAVRDVAAAGGSPAVSGTPSDLSFNIGWPRLDRLLESAVTRVKQDGGRRLGEAFLSNAPKLMFLFLPLVAAVAMLFYWKPRRLYAEHLVLFLHVHAFLFLWLAITSLIGAVALLDWPLIGLLEFANVLLLLYVPYYVFRAMRVVYGNGPALTAVKFASLSVVYFALLGITMSIGVMYSMLSL